MAVRTSLTQNQKNPETEKYVCNIINASLQLETPLQVQNLGIAHPLTFKKGTPLLLNFSKELNEMKFTAKNYY